MGEFLNGDGVFVNYTKAQEITDEKYNLSPRKQFCDGLVGSEYPMS
jgi:hypothetical protein